MDLLNHTSKSLACTLVAAGLFICSFAHAANENERLQKIQQDINSLRSNIDSDKREQSSIQENLKTLDKEIAKVAKKLRALDAKIKKQRTTQQQLQKETRTLNSKLIKQKELLGQQMRAGYSAGQQQALKLLLNQTNPAEAGRTLAYYGYFTQAQLKTVHDTQLSIQQLKTATEKLQESTRKLEALKNDHDLQRLNFDQQKRSRKQVLAKLSEELQSKEQRLEKLLADEQALSELVKELALASQPKFKALKNLKGKLRYPIKGKLRHAYGESRKLGKMRWKGLFIKGREGQDIRTIAPGKVVFADWIRGYGLMIIIDHGDNYMSLYGHNQGLYKEAGDAVQENEIIAALGNSGGSPELGVYFELRHNGKPIDPKGWFK